MANPGNRPLDCRMTSKGYSRIRTIIQQQMKEQSTGISKSEETINKLKRPKPPRSQQHIDSLKLAAKRIGLMGPKKDEGWYKAVSKPVEQFTREGQFIKGWESIQQASNELGINRSDIGNVCRGRHKSAGGFLWKFKK
jgi:hypothetical protein